MINTIVLDLDGTLLNSEGVINPLTKQTLIDIQSKGFHVILATGRPTPGVVKSAQDLELASHDGYVLTFNGAHTMNFATREVVYENTLSTNLAKEVLSHLENYDVHPMICIDEYMYVEDVYASVVNLNGEPLNIIQYEARGCNYKLCEVDNLVSFTKTPLYKVLITGEPEYLDANLEAMKAALSDKVTIAKSAPFFVEFTNKGVDKSQSLTTILDRIGVTHENVIAFGDGMNDYSLLENAKIGVAMGNATQSLKDIANYVTDTNDNDGIVSALKHFNLID